jgi:hypothetical protein
MSSQKHQADFGSLKRIVVYTDMDSAAGKTCIHAEVEPGVRERAQISSEK